MAAYGALVSIMHIIDQLQHHHHPRPPISLDKQQVQSLTRKVTFLQDFLEGYSHANSKEAEDLENRITVAAYAAEDVIESYIVGQIHAGSISNGGEKISSVDFYQDLQKVIEDMDSIQKEAMVMKEKIGDQRDQLPFRSAPTGHNRSTMVGRDDVLYEMMDKLTRGQPDRQIIPITGMGGIGKTTLARNIYENQVITQYFDILAWATISQEYSRRGIVLQLILCLKGKQNRKTFSEKSEDELEEMLHKSLSGRRYLIILDDIWNIEVWDGLKFFFPDNKNGSSIMLTARLSKLAFQLTNSHGLEMNFLDEDTSWDLLCKSVFGEEDCPTEFEEIGKKVANNCKGLPLSIIVIEGVLTKSEQTQQYWEHVAENLSSIVNLDANEHCLQILSKSYKILPVHLKSCFLYIGVFPEDNEIHISTLIKLWVAEGFLKPIDGKSLEDVAKDYLKELIDRNLILVDKHSFNGKIKYCKIHDLLRDVCTREAQKQKFLYVAGLQSINVPRDINTERRICIHESTSGKQYSPQILPALESPSLARSLIFEFHKPSASVSFCRLLRVSSTVYKEHYGTCSLEPSFRQVNLRYLHLSTNWAPLLIFPSTVSLLWNLQTLIVRNRIPAKLDVPPDFWKMPQLRHVQIQLLRLSDPPNGYREGQDDDIVLENLQTLSCIYNFKCPEEVVKRIPNIKKLKIYFDCRYEKGSSPKKYCLYNLVYLHKLESLDCEFHPDKRFTHLVKSLIFPHSLKKLTLMGTKFNWDDLTETIGSLPFLEVLKLKEDSCIGSHWETVEGEFCSLKFLQIEWCDLEDWMTDSTHFPRLKHLLLLHLGVLKEIPSTIGDIPALELIQVLDCNDSVVESAKRILEEQEEFGNVDLKVRTTSDEEEDW